MVTYLAHRGQQLGPFEDAAILAGLASGQYSPEDLGWREGMAEWVPLRTLYPVSAPPPLPQPARFGDDPGIRLLLPVGRSGWAIAAGYLGLFSLILLPAPLAVIVSLIALRDLRRHRHDLHPKHGLGRAIFGLVLGLLGTACLLFLALQALRP